MKSELLKFNQLWADLGDVYRAAALAADVSETVHSILYLLTLEEKPVPQCSMSAETGLPKQTINTALRKLEAEGFIMQLPGANRRTKNVQLTESGAQLAERVVGPIISRELRALGAMSDEERRTLAELVQKFTALLKEKV